MRERHNPALLQIFTSNQSILRAEYLAAQANKQFPRLDFAANNLLSAHTTTAAAEQNWLA
jgi:hypothetical protein